MTRRKATPNPVGLPLCFQSILWSDTLLGALLLIIYPVFSSILCLSLTLLLNLLTRFVGSLLDLPLLFLNFFLDLSPVHRNLLLLVLEALLQIKLLRRGGRRRDGARIGLPDARLRSGW